MSKPLLPCPETFVRNLEVRWIRLMGTGALRKVEAKETKGLGSGTQA